ncbi:MAG: 6-bladed beta-propeller [Candidatus Aminicenantes bacterium]|nr:6-bladed beta-propeller [Candidatus Aminicenantes bacterium]
MESKTKIVSIILLFSTFMMFVSCGQKQEKVEKIMEDGVEVVLNHLEPYKIKGEPSHLNLDEELIIDFEKEEFTELGMTDVLGFDVDSDGNIYFLISRSTKNFIFKFDDNGNFLFSFGRKGQGPGELGLSRYFAVNELDQIVVTDFGRKKLHVFERNGDLIKEISLASNYRRAGLLRSGKILAMKESFNKGEGRLEFPIILCNEDLEEMKMLHPGKHMPNFTFANKVNGLQLYIDYNVWKISRGLIYVGNYGSGYEFLIYDEEGNLLRKIRKEYQKVKVPDQIKEKIFNWLKNNLTQFEQVKTKLYFPEFYPSFQFFFLDERSRLYVMTYERGKGPNGFMYDIFNPNGVLIGRIELENYGFLASSPIINPLPLNVVAKNQSLYCLREGENGYKGLVVYKMKWE